ncbi:MAG: hypothetical protein ACJA0E_001550 [Bermanella sp.]|jgi:hypothetical protein
MKLWQLISNVVFFQITWFGAAFGYEAYALISLVLLAVTQVFSPEVIKAVILGVIVAIALGLAMDSTLHMLGIYQFPDASELSILNLPYWLLIMWAAFSLTIFTSFHWSLNRHVIFVILCALMGPFSYIAGRELNIIEFSNNDILFMVGAWGSWAVIFLVIWKNVIAVKFANQKTVTEV